MRDEFEQFPVEKKRIAYEEPPELIFFDTDDEQEEADFIRVDDLFALHPEAAEKLTGRLTFTLFPQRQDDLIDSRLSKRIHRTLALAGIRLERPLEKARIRPKFAQWQIELKENDEAEQIAREIRADLEELLHNVKNLGENERFWSDSCFVCPVGKEISDETIIRTAGHFRASDPRDAGEF